VSLPAQGAIWGSGLGVVAKDAGNPAERVKLHEFSGLEVVDPAVVQNNAAHTCQHAFQREVQLWKPRCKAAAK
jgi:hypothetical protein